METKQYDVAIIGGGPGATASAIYATQRGLSVCIVEREVFPRDRPGETLHPGTEVIFNQLGINTAIEAAQFIRHKGHWIAWGNQPQKFQAFNEEECWYGYQAYRSTFDNILLEQAIKQGTTVFTETRVNKLILDNQRVIGIETSKGDLLAKYIIDASGGWQCAARQLNIKFAEHSPPLFVRYGYVKGYCEIREDAPLIQADPKGWTWTAKVAPDTYQWTRLVFKEEDIVKNWIPKEFEGLEKLGSDKGANMTWRIASCLAGPGFFLVGDAAAILDPASSHGVLRALMSGIRAADFIFHILHNQCSEYVAQYQYEQWMNEWFEHDVSHLRSFYKELGCDVTLKEPLLNT